MFDFDGIEPTLYVADKMLWWQEQEEPRGMEIEDDLENQICDFAEQCHWRKAEAEVVTIMR